MLKKLLVEDGFPLGMVVLQKNSDVSFEFLIDFLILSFHSHGGRSGKRFMAPSEDFSHWPFDGAK